MVYYDFKFHFYRNNSDTINSPLEVYLEDFFPKIKTVCFKNLKTKRI